MSASQIDRPDGPLVSGQWLEDHLGQPGLRVLDVRGRYPGSSRPAAKRVEYEESHVPGAVFVDWTEDFVDLADPVPNQLARPEQFAAKARQLGISDSELVVTYDDYYGLYAARIAWAFRCYGVEARVLDGGWPTWLDEARPVDVGRLASQPATFEVRPAGPLRLTLADLHRARDGDTVVVDARPRHQFVGEPDAPGTGHMPGALALPYQELVDGATGLFQSPEAIRRLVAAAGIDPDAPPADTITTCGAGLSATLTLIALELVGVQVRGVFDGGFNEWSADPTLPVAYGNS